VSPRNRISKVVVLGQEQARQQEIDRMRAEHQAEFDKIEEEMPELDELLSICTEPPHEWLEERWS
jgi:hypothetical protein